MTEQPPLPDTSGINVIPVRSKRDMRAFIDLPWKIYQDDPIWVPPLRLERRLHFSGMNPFLKHGQWQAFLATRHGEVVGRISAQIDHLHRDLYGDNTGHFGLFECIDDDTVSASLFAAAESWLHEHGASQITGPFNLSINQDCGILVDGFDTPPVVMMPHSPPYYDRLIQAGGYAKAKDLLAYWVDVQFRNSPAMKRLVKRYAADVTVRPLRRKQFAKEMEVLRDIFNDAWSDNWGFVPFTKEEFSEMGSMLRLLLPDDFIQIAELDGEAIAFSVTLPNLNEIFLELDGSLFPFGWLHLIKRLRSESVKTGRLPLLGVRKKFHRTPLGAALAFMVTDASWPPVLAKGISEAEMSWILEDNKPIRSILDNVGSKQYKTYRIYSKDLTASDPPLS